MDSIPWYVYLLGALAGLAAGVINTLAGNGSAITLPMLALLGLPAGMANGTNRVGVAAQSLTGYLTFRKKGVHTGGAELWWLITPAVAGSIAGAQLAVELNEKYLNLCLASLMVVLLYLVIKDPERWLAAETPHPKRLRSTKTVMLMFAVGLYGGFIQAGVGILILAALVLGAGYSLNQANSIKSLLVFAFTLPALFIFIINGQVNWFLGLLLTAGQAVGAWLAATFAVNMPTANQWIRVLLIAVIIVAIVHFGRNFAG
ncbi:sulfite exporter TauE/SafE family protein [Sphingobacteriales bacterium UPWRP_1]|nr:hypothetical protein BVG80_11500 [Sphingobacteriales bacterium TSM_CSM]PSJ76469.1 sulfite exporter TauE/SafE family protein [Sphingobacteriales bacterium UPWRP_1]